MYAVTAAVNADRKSVPVVKCPTCNKPVEWCAESPYRPFCSARCRQIDLGAWATESYRIPSATPPDSETEPPVDD